MKAYALVLFTTLSIVPLHFSKAQSMGCPNSCESWLSLRDRIIGSTQLKPPPEGGEHAFDWLKGCVTQANDPVISACFKQILVTADEQKRLVPSGDENDLGLNQEPNQSMNSLDTIPAPFKDQDFLKKISDPNEAIHAAEDIQKKLPKGTIFIRYSGSVGSMDNADVAHGKFERIVFMIPGEKIDRWIAIPVAPLSSTGNGQRNQFSQIIVDKKATSTQGNPPLKVNRPKMYFRDYWRYYGQDRITIDLLSSDMTKSEQKEQSNCRLCHGTGINPIYPGAFGTTPENLNKAEILNRQIASYGISPESTLPPVALKAVPALGPIDSPVREKVLDDCTKNLLPEQRDKIKSAMNCTSCHSGQLLKNKGTVIDSFKTVREHISKGEHELAEIIPTDASKDTIINAAIMNGFMPPGTGDALTVKERAALKACLFNENQKLFENKVKGDCAYDSLVHIKKLDADAKKCKITEP